MNEKKVVFHRGLRQLVYSMPMPLPKIVRVWDESWFRNEGIRLDEYKLISVPVDGVMIVREDVVDADKAYIHVRRIPISINN